MAFTDTFYFHGKKKNTVYRHDLELTIQMKFLSLRIPVEVTAYTRLDKHRTSDKTFTVTFQSSAHARAALQLIEQRRLDFRMNEARPSPRYHVKFIVLCRQGFFLPVNAGSFWMKLYFFHVCRKVYTVSPVKWDTYFLVNRVENQKLNQTTAELPFG